VGFILEEGFVGRSGRFEGLGESRVGFVVVEEG
jgi:hypothetical protein